MHDKRISNQNKRDVKKIRLSGIENKYIETSNRKRNKGKKGNERRRKHLRWRSTTL
jgi:hypothetical protein